MSWTSRQAISCCYQRQPILPVDDSGYFASFDGCSRGRLKGGCNQDWAPPQDSKAATILLQPVARPSRMHSRLAAKTDGHTDLPTSLLGRHAENLVSVKKN